MTATEPQSLPPALPPARSPRASWFQFSLRVVLLLTAAIAVWTAGIVNRREIPPLKQRIELMRPLARELVIQDPLKIAVVKCEELWYDENEWEVYLPEGNYVLAVATQGIDGQGTPLVNQSASLTGGRFRLALTQQRTDRGWRVSVTKDGSELLVAEESTSWHPGHGSVGGGQFATSAQADSASKVELFRRRFTRPVPGKNNTTSYQTPAGPCEGVMLWIEREKAPATEAIPPSKPATP